VLASLAAGSPTTEFLIRARVVQGIGGALMSLAIITTYFDPDQRGGAIGMWSAATTIVTVVGPVLGGLLADAGLARSLRSTCRWGTTLLILYFKVPSRAEEVSGQIDYPGAVLDAQASWADLRFYLPA